MVLWWWAAGLAAPVDRRRGASCRSRCSSATAARSSASTAVGSALGLARRDASPRPSCSSSTGWSCRAPGARAVAAVARGRGRGSSRCSSPGSRSNSLHRFRPRARRSAFGRSPRRPPRTTRPPRFAELLDSRDAAVVRSSRRATPRRVLASAPALTARRCSASTCSRSSVVVVGERRRRCAPRSNRQVGSDGRVSRPTTSPDSGTAHRRLRSQPVRADLPRHAVARPRAAPRTTEVAATHESRRSGSSRSRRRTAARCGRSPRRATTGTQWTWPALFPERRIASDVDAERDALADALAARSARRSRPVRGRPGTAPARRELRDRRQGRGAPPAGCTRANLTVDRDAAETVAACGRLRHRLLD